MIAATIKPTDWHKLPPLHKGPCPICGISTHNPGEHRAIGEDEGLDARWEMRRRGLTGWRYFHVGSQSENGEPRKRPPRTLRGHQIGPTKKTVDRIARAAALMVQGMTKPLVAKAVGSTVPALNDLWKRYPDIWARANASARDIVDETIHAAIDKIRKEAGTAAVLTDPELFLHRAEMAEQYLVSCGESLFPPNDKMTLGRFFETYYLPTCLSDATGQTRDNYRVMLRRWAIFTGDPAIVDITSPALAMFRDCLGKIRGLKAHLPMSSTTVAGYLRRLQTLLDKAGPSGQRNRDAAGIINHVPWVKGPRERPKLPRIVTPEIFRLVYDGCVAAYAPRQQGFKPAAWWRGLLIVTKNTGLRRGTLLSMRMEHIDWQARRLVLPAEFLKSDRPHVIPLNREAYEHLLKIRTARELIFGWPHCRRHFDTTFHKIQSAAGITRKDHFGLHDLRKTLASQLARTSLAAAQFALGHAASNVTMRHYAAYRKTARRPAALPFAGLLTTDFPLSILNFRTHWKDITVPPSHHVC